MLSARRYNQTENKLLIIMLEHLITCKLFDKESNKTKSMLDDLYPESIRSKMIPSMVKFLKDNILMSDVFS